MEQRELGMVEIESRLNTALMTTYPLKALLRLPDRAISEEDVPAVLIIEGKDTVYEYSKRGPLGYPVKRALEVFIECWDYTDGDVWDLYDQARKAVLASKGILVADKVFIVETGAFGPFNNNFTRSKALQLHLQMTYTDVGPDFTT